MERHEEKRNAIILVCILILIVLSIIFNIPTHIGYYISRWNDKVNNFYIFENDFTAVAEFCRDFFENDNTDHGSDYFYYEDNSLIYDGEYLPLSDELKNSVHNIRNAFKKNNSALRIIRYYDTGIYFQIENGQYALYYSFNGEKPKFIPASNNACNISVRKINENWYHVIKNPDNY